MTVQDYLRVVRERWKIIAIVVVLGILAALAVFLVRPPEYTASTSLYVSAQVGDSPQQAFQGAQLSEQRVKSYNELATSERVLGETVNRLGLSRTPAQLAPDVTSTSSLDSVIINISASDRAPSQAAAIANTVGTVITETVAELERPAAPNGIPPVAVRIVQPASVPMTPSSTSLPIMIAIGLLGGLIVGVGAAFLRNALDTSIKTPNDLLAAVGAPNLGIIAFDSKVPDQPLTVQSDPQSPRAEAFRQLRTNLQFVDVDNPRKVVVITSSLPSEGKTTTVANVAIALASTGSRVLVIEADLRRPKLSELLGVDRSVGLTRVLAGRTSLDRAIQPWGGGTFDLLASGPTPPNPSELLSSQQMRALIDEVRSRYDLVLIDTPPLLPVTDAAAIAPYTDGALLVCRFKRTKRQQAIAAAEALRSVSVEPLGTVFTMVPVSGPMAYAKYNSYYGTNIEDARNQTPVGGESGRPQRDSAVPGGAPSVPPSPSESTTRIQSSRGRR